MRWVNYRSRDGREHAGLIRSVDDHGGQQIGAQQPVRVDRSQQTDAGARVHGIRASLPEVLGDLAAAAREATDDPAEVLPLADAQLLAPITQPPSIRDFMAFESHVVTALAAIGQTVDPVWYDQPVFYFTNPAAVFGPGAQVPMAPGTRMWDYELEVAAIIGREGVDLDPATAADHIAGYTILCDWSARDLQGAEMRVGLGPAKGKDTATSIGPWLVTPDELEQHRSGLGYDLAMRARVNGTAYSSGSWADLHWSFGEMLAYASRGTRLVPGDVIGSGTVGSGCILELARVHGAAAYPWLQPGDLVELEVDALGVLAGRVGSAAPVRPLRQPMTREEGLAMRGAHAIGELPAEEPPVGAG